MKIKQQGVGLVEVLVALVLLAISVLGFAALQLRAVDSSLEANKQVIALTIARDLAEKMRANPQATRTGKYKVAAVEVP
ncbi:MAG: type IV pilus modification protein PilV, partial [Acinetobacter sp.]